MQTSIATVSLSGSLNEKLEAIAAAKFDAVEIFENDLVTFNGTPADVRRATQQLELGIVTLQPFRDFEGMPDAEALDTLTFTEANGRTRLEMLMQHATQAHRDAHINSGMEDGLQDALNHLEQVAISLA